MKAKIGVTVACGKSKRYANNFHFKRPELRVVVIGVCNFRRTAALYVGSVTAFFPKMLVLYFMLSGVGEHERQATENVGCSVVFFGPACWPTYAGADRTNYYDPSYIM